MAVILSRPLYVYGSEAIMEAGLINHKNQKKLT